MVTKIYRINHQQKTEKLVTMDMCCNDKVKRVFNVGDAIYITKKFHAQNTMGVVYNIDSDDGSKITVSTTTGIHNVTSDDIELLPEKDQTIFSDYKVGDEFTMYTSYPDGVRYFTVLDFDGEYYSLAWNGFSKSSAYLPKSFVHKYALVIEPIFEITERTIVIKEIIITEDIIREKFNIPNDVNIIFE